ncbi:TIGR04255 family protein [Roseateles sp. So40a]|uniref:TIGR04255 family protein n=1 Tax=Roseateles sp. So40a TaxID=3400226 RepID=UPI003A8C47CF
MATQRHLRNAPIREALIDIRCETPKSPIDLVVAYANKIAVSGSQVNDIWDGEVTFKLDAAEGEPNSLHSATRVGKRVDLPIGKHRDVVQLKARELTFSRLAGYENWESMATPAFECWSGFARSVPMARVDQIAVRYINAIQLPLPIVDFREYLVAPPDIPDGLPQMLRGYMSRVSFGQDDMLANVTQVLEGLTPDGSEASVLLDIEVASPCSMDPLDVGGIREIADRLRNFKNEVFFRYLTEKTLGRYE